MKKQAVNSCSFLWKLTSAGLLLGVTSLLRPEGTVTGVSQIFVWSSARGKESGDKKQAFVKRATKGGAETQGGWWVQGEEGGDNSEPEEASGLDEEGVSPHDRAQIPGPPGVRLAQRAEKWERRS